MSIDVGMPYPSGDHPLLEDLVALVDGELREDESGAIEQHVGACSTCRGVLAGLDTPIESDEDEPHPVIDFFDFVAPSRLGVSGEPEPGEVWQLDWARDAVFAVVLSGQDADRLVAPVTPEAPRSPESAARIEIEEPGPPIFMWHEPLAAVPLGVFSELIGHLSERSVRSTEFREQVERALRPDNDPSTPFALEFDSPEAAADALHRADFRAALSALASATWIPTSDAEPIRLCDLLLERDLRPAALSSLTGLPASAITELLRGVRQATPREAAALAKALDVPANRVGGPVSIPNALVRAIERPVHRAAIRVRAASGGLSEALARLRVAEAVMAMPARTTTKARDDVEAWDELIRHYLDA